ncbi:MAG: Rrf2 family transcriptional regulator [Candidatus Stygibacter australis]|nr:Rrf2 family transcriptional regulator [Candidatus Stygibacter australis]
MYISTKTGYALRAMIELALTGDEQPLSITELSSRQHLPSKYLERLFALLRKSELVTSKKGINGGYLLARKAETITLQDVMQAVEESHYHSYCRHQKDDAEYCQGISCHLRGFWDRIGTDLESYFSSINLQKIINKYIRGEHETDLFE